MDVKPVKRYRVPAYPTRLEVLADPDILANNVPHNWHQNAVTAAALGAFLAANACAQADPGAKSLLPKAAVVAPIFEHGSGRGSTGCVAVAPPVFLSEEEALQVITEELTGAGLEVTATNVVLKRVKISQHIEKLDEFGNDGKWLLNDIPELAEPLSIDITDDKHRVAVEYVSESDYFRLGGPRSFSTSQRYDFCEVATGVAKAVEKKGPAVYFGAFYDPLVQADRSQFRDEKDCRKRWEQEQAQGEAEAKRLLRLQVKDFVDWLKGQGVI